ncbi:MAG: metallophosphoesterase [Saccharospirillaceae bacterium]|nr:metallophosphoesterase [Saccharospirillaceae bacterium]MCD8533089.1 metallophosphoesterase [Saccharospirillaceae bacterium]
MKYPKLLIPLVFISGLLTGCNDEPENKSDTPDVVVDKKTYKPFTIGLLPDTQGGSDATGQAHVALHPLREVLKHQSAAGTDMVIALGDLTDEGSAVEWQEWTSVAKTYRDQGMEFLPVMGNHEMNYSYTHAWVKTMRDYIPEDAVHMPGYEWINYYVIRENILIIGLAYYNLPIAIDWIEETLEKTTGKVDHVVVASHDGLIGAKYGLTREQIVEGTKDDDWVYSVADKIRALFSQHDVIYVQGHEHQYQRSLITKDTAQTTLPSGSTPSGGNYRMNAYTQIMAGNASYKGYEFRYGERELVQMIIAQKNATKSGGSTHFDVNSGLLSFNNDRVSYQGYFAEHTATSNDSDQAFTASWQLHDQFTRTGNRCETVVYPNSIPEGTRSVMVFQPDYITDICLAEDGSVARLAGGVNNTFNRTDSRGRDMEYIPGFSRAETLTDLTRLAYQWMYQYHESWTPNLNGEHRVIPNTVDNVLDIPETTIDLKEHITLSWTPATAKTLSDILIISGTQNQTGVYQGDYGEAKDIRTDSGLPGSTTDASLAKAPVVLPATATRSWNISDAVADAYAVEFKGSEKLSAESAQLASLNGDQWQALTSTNCIATGRWLESYLQTPPVRAAECANQPLVGYDAAENTWWTVLNRDAELALITR